MEVYEVLCDGVNEVRQFRFSVLAEAMAEAERICKRFSSEARVVRVIGTYVPECRWISNGVPGEC